MTSNGPSASGSPDAVTPFRVDIAQGDLDDLAQRLRLTRWPSEIGDNADWSAGANLAYMRELTDYWLNGYDWRAQERAMNAFSHFRTSIDGTPVHFIHERGKGPAPVPLILNHGWPWTFWDMRKIIRPLADPAAFGGDPADAFDVIAPSLPGFGFSSPLTEPGMNFFRIADLWPKLMERLGYGRFAVQGGDIGSMVAAQIGHKYPEKVLGVHLHLILPFKAPYPKPEDYAPEEAGWAQKNAHFYAQGAGYMTMQMTRPQTIALALHDSPVGLASWLVEKRHGWSDSRGDVERLFSKDDLLTTVMLYWLTETYVTSARHYFESARNKPDVVHDREPVVEAPTGVIQFEGDILLGPRKWAERYYNLKRWTVKKDGGHFAPMEAPEDMIEDIRAFFRPLRETS